MLYFIIYSINTYAEKDHETTNYHTRKPPKEKNTPPPLKLNNIRNNKNPKSPKKPPTQY